MLGAIAGDIIGSVYERRSLKQTDFPLFHEKCRFTDDTVMTIGIAHAILEQIDYGTALKLFGQKYPDAGYGQMFRQWIFEAEVKPYNSWGNGSAMRVSPVGFAYNDLDAVLREAAETAKVSHNHPEGIKGAQATALAIFMARHGASKIDIRTEISQRFGYNLDRTVAEIRPTYHFDVSCQGSVPESIIAFLDSTDYEEAIRLAISLGGDSDTMACIAGGIAQAYYKTIPSEIVDLTRQKLPADLLNVVDRFNQQYGL